MQRKVVLALMAVLGFAGWLGTPWTTSTASAALAVYALPGEAVFPEGVTYERRTGNFYVTSTTDGTIFRGNVFESRASVFLPGGQDGRTTAVGLKVDNRGRLFIAGGGTGSIFVYDVASKNLLASFNNGFTESTFVNDVALTPDGSAYFTDSQRPYLYRVYTNNAGQLRFERFLDFTNTVLQYQQGFNVNGIAASENGRYLIVVQTNTGKLFRIDVASKRVTEIALGGETLTAGDGLLLQGTTLYVVRNQLGLIAKFRLNRTLTSGRLVGTTTDPTFAFPTTIARTEGRLLVVNSQFNNRGPGLTPNLPFTVSSIRVP